MQTAPKLRWEVKLITLELTDWRVDHKWTGKLLKFPKKILRILTQVITGHTSLKRHMFIMGYEDNPDCINCGMAETAIHVLTECPKYAGARMALLGKPILDIGHINKLELGRILKFLKTTNLWEM